MDPEMDRFLSFQRKKHCKPLEKLYISETYNIFFNLVSFSSRRAGFGIVYLKKYCLEKVETAKSYGIRPELFQARGTGRNWIEKGNCLEKVKHAKSIHLRHPWTHRRVSKKWSNSVSGIEIKRGTISGPETAPLRSSRQCSNPLFPLGFTQKTRPQRDPFWPENGSKIRSRKGAEIRPKA